MNEDFPELAADERKEFICKNPLCAASLAITMAPGEKTRRVVYCPFCGNDDVLREV